MTKMVKFRRYITAATAKEWRHAGRAEWTPTGAQTFNIVTLDWTEWYVVPDDDPRVDTVEELPVSSEP